MLTAATSTIGSAENSRIRSVLRLTVANVIGPPSVTALMLPELCHTCSKIDALLQIYGLVRRATGRIMHFMHVFLAEVTKK
jgi:hypothetical protein